MQLTHKYDIVWEISGFFQCFPHLFAKGGKLLDQYFSPKAIRAEVRAADDLDRRICVRNGWELPPKRRRKVDTRPIFRMGEALRWTLTLKPYPMLDQAQACCLVAVLMYLENADEVTPHVTELQAIPGGRFEKNGRFSMEDRRAFAYFNERQVDEFLPKLHAAWRRMRAEPAVRDALRSMALPPPSVAPPVVVPHPAEVTEMLAEGKHEVGDERALLRLPEERREQVRAVCQRIREDPREWIPLSDLEAAGLPKSTLNRPLSRARSDVDFKGTRPKFVRKDWTLRYVLLTWSPEPR